jgi:hypothetical protein
MRTSLWLSLAFALVLGTVASAAPVPAAVEAGAATIGDRLQRLDPSCRLGVAALLDSARADSLPVEPLLQRALEGQTKRAPGPRIVQAVEILLSRLRESRHLLGPERGEDELVAGAGCLGAGVDSTTLRRIGATRRAEPLVVPLIVLTDLVGRGAPIETAARVTMEMVGAGLGDRQFMELRAGVQEDLRLGIGPAEAVLARFRAVSGPSPAPGQVPVIPRGPRDGAIGR